MKRTLHEPDRSALPPDAADDAAQDAWLQRSLRDAPVPPAVLEALNRRVLAQWQERHAGISAPQQRNAGPTLIALLARRPVWIGSTGLLVAGAVLLGLWLQRADPVLEELMQPDVLSQMAAGQM